MTFDFDNFYCIVVEEKFRPPFMTLIKTNSKSTASIVCESRAAGGMQKSKDSPGGARCTEKIRFSFRHGRPFWEQQLFLSLRFLSLPLRFLGLFFSSCTPCSVSTYLPTPRGPFTG